VIIRTVKNIADDILNWLFGNNKEHQEMVKKRTEQQRKEEWLFFHRVQAGNEFKIIREIGESRRSDIVFGDSVEGVSQILCGKYDSKRTSRKTNKK
jgi:hypothetical protein